MNNIQVWSWRWARIQAKIIIKEELFWKYPERNIWTYKDFIGKYKLMEAKWVEWKVRICILQYLFWCMQRHFDKRIANWEMVGSILSNQNKYE